MPLGELGDAINSDVVKRFPAETLPAIQYRARATACCRRAHFRSYVGQSAAKPNALCDAQAIRWALQVNLLR